MIIKFSNLGSIQETELDLRPLTVIIGPNNTSKTYLAYSLYGLWSRSRSRLGLDGLRTLAQSEQLSDDKQSVKIPLAALASILRSKTSADARLFTKELGSFFQDTSGKVFQKTQISVDITDADIMDGLLRAGIKHNDGNVSIPAGSSTMYTGSSSARQGIAIRNPRGHEELIEQLDRGCLLPPFLLPAERNALVITYNDNSVCVIYHIDAKTQPPLFEATESRPEKGTFTAIHRSATSNRTCSLLWSASSSPMPRSTGATMRFSEPAGGAANPAFTSTLMGLT